MEHSLKRKIMRRVYAIYLVRRATQPMLLKLYALLACLGASATYVSLAAIYSNMPMNFDWQAQYRFYTEALIHTETVVRLLAVGVAMAASLLVYDVVRSALFLATRRQSRLQVQ